MEKKELASILSEILVPIGFKKKGNYWVVNGAEITKMVNLQKSQFSNSFYINYGYILNAIPLDGMMHIYNRVASIDKVENLRIDELLNLENNIPDEERASELKKVLLEKLVYKISSVNTEADVLEELKKQPNLNNVPLVVKRHFNLPE
ncbi:DUF4304 domain-containing protein [Myroides odoratus]|uniref:DUF4304 domain-containing protein n=1 Tax=Myroides odoratus TaxID=256 RepID=UPI00333F9C4C